jgi:dihydroflavonol-4-reductase
VKTFVTGATGLLGNNLVQTLLDAGHEVKCLVRSPEKAAAVFGNSPVRVVVGDMKNIGEFANEMAGCDVVFHAAAYFREYYQPGSDDSELHRTNLEGTIELLTQAEAKGVPKVVYVSSSGVIGMKPSGDPGDENTPPGEAVKWNRYFASKVETGKAIAEFEKRHRIAVVQVLPGWMFGPGDRGPTGSGQLVLNYLKRKIYARIQGGSNSVDARDVAFVMLRAAERGGPGDRYLAGGHYVTFGEIMRDLESVSGVPAPRFEIPYAVALALAWVSLQFGSLTGKEVLVTPETVRVMDARLKVDSSRAERELGAQFRPFRDTLRDEVEWYRRNGYGDGKK